MKSYKFILAIMIPMTILFIGCKQEDYKLGDLTAPADLSITATVAGVTADLPNGDGTGNVDFVFSAKNVISYKVDFGDGHGADFVPAHYTKKYNKIGTKTYRVIVTAVGTGGITSTITKDVTVYYAYEVTPDIVTMLTGDSPTGKKWKVDGNAYGHMGNGPGPDRPDGIEETFEPTWWQADPNSKGATGMYNDVYIFTNTKKFTCQTGGDLYGYKDMFARDFDPTTPGSQVWDREWKLTYSDFTEGFDYDGDAATATQPERVYIVFDKLGFLGFFGGSHKYMILEISDTNMYVRCTSPGTNDSAWYIKLIAVE